ncbi:MAG: hypothetical protein HZA17_05495 [Nitrospirae bacterium]|nr:hypothetical protein [Nitrospirota bacterium]
MINGIKNIIVYPPIIALAYWITDGLLSPALSDTIKAWIIIKSLGLPLIAIAVFLLIATKINLKPKEIIMIGCCSVFWIWLLSSCYMPIMNLFRPHEIKISLKDFGVFILMFPLVAIEISTYSGGLFGLALTSIGLPITAIIISKNKKRCNNLLQATRA